MGLNAFTIDGKSTADFGVLISGTAVHGAPQRDVEILEIPGRDGTLSIDNGRFLNIAVTYDCYITNDFVNRFMAFKAFILSNSGYRRLEDTYNADYFRKARFVGGIEATTQMLSSVGRFSLTFDCDPRMYRKDGLDPITIDSNSVINNPTFYASKPLIRAYGTGKFKIGAKEFEIVQSDGITDIDCEMMEAYHNGINCNGKIKGDFPSILPGANQMTLNGVSKIEITPRWWTI